MVANIRTGATVGGAIRYNEEKVNRGQGIVANGSLLERSFSANAFEQQFYPEAEGRRVYRNTSEQTPSSSKEPYRPDPLIHPLDAILELADGQAYEEEQQQ